MVHYYPEANSQQTRLRSQVKGINVTSAQMSYKSQHLWILLLGLNSLLNMSLSWNPASHPLPPKKNKKNKINK